MFKSTGLNIGHPNHGTLRFNISKRLGNMDFISICKFTNSISNNISLFIF